MQSLEALQVRNVEEYRKEFEVAAGRSFKCQGPPVEIIRADQGKN